MAVYDHGDPTPTEQYLLELVNRTRADPEAAAKRLDIDLNEGLSPGTISSDPVPPLAFNRFILKAVRQHNSFMISRGTLSHTGEGGSSPRSRMEAAGHTNFTAEAENLAVTSETEPAKAAESVHDNLFIDQSAAGRGHRRNLFKAGHEIGIGVTSGPFKGSAATWATMDITTKISPDSTKFIVGVVFRDRDRDGSYKPGEGLGQLTMSVSKGNFSAVTSESGGYAIPIDTVNGEVEVRMHVDDIRAVRKNVFIQARSIKVDFGFAPFSPIFRFI